MQLAFHIVQRKYFNVHLDISRTIFLSSLFPKKLCPGKRFHAKIPSGFLAISESFSCAGRVKNYIYFWSPRYIFSMRYSKCRLSNTTQKMIFSIKDFFSKCDQIRRKSLLYIQYCEIKPVNSKHCDWKLLTIRSNESVIFSFLNNEKSLE